MCSHLSRLWFPTVLMRAQSPARHRKRLPPPRWRNPAFSLPDWSSQQARGVLSSRAFGAALPPRFRAVQLSTGPRRVLASGHGLSRRGPSPPVTLGRLVGSPAGKFSGLPPGLAGRSYWVRSYQPLGFLAKLLFESRLGRSGLFRPLPRALAGSSWSALFGVVPTLQEVGNSRYRLPRLPCGGGGPPCPSAVVAGRAWHGSSLAQKVGSWQLIGQTRL